MRQKNEPWLEHLKERVKNYERTLPENDWNDFESKLVLSSGKRKHTGITRMVAIVLTLLLPTAIALYFGRKENKTEKQVSSVFMRKEKTLPLSSLPAYLMPPHKHTPAPVTEAKSIREKTNGENANRADTFSTASRTNNGSTPQDNKGKIPYCRNYVLENLKILPKRPLYAVTFTLSTGGGSTGNSFISKSFSRGDPGNITSQNEKLYWDDFKAQLIEHPDEIPDAQARASLLQIADDNRGQPMLEHIHYNLPVSFGLSLRKSLDKHWGISVGLQYTYLSSESSVGDKSEWIRRQQFHYIGISLKLDRILYTSGPFSLYVTGGGSMEKSISGKSEQDFVIGGEKVYSCRNRIRIRPVQFSAQGALGIQYNLSRSTGVFAEPSANYYFKDGSNKKTIRDEHPLHFNLQFGLRWNY